MSYEAFRLFLFVSSEKIRGTVALIYPTLALRDNSEPLSFDADIVRFSVGWNASLAVLSQVPRCHCFHTFGLTVMHVLSSSRV